MVVIEDLTQQAAEEAQEAAVIEGEEAGEESTEGSGEENVSAEPDEVVVSIGDDAPEEEEEKAAPEWVRDLRKANREDKRRIRELEDQIKANAPAPKAVQLGKEPTLEDCDYDAEKFKAELIAWHERKRESEQQATKAEQEKEAQAKAWQARLDSYGAAKKEIKVKDFDEAELIVQDAFSQTQQGIVLQGAKNPAMVIYALGKNPKKAKELAEISDPVKFAFAVAELELKLKVTPKKPPPPEKVPTGTGRMSGAVDSQLERLRAEAEKTGDISKLMAYKRSKRAA